MDNLELNHLLIHTASTTDLKTVEYFLLNKGLKPY